MFYGHKLANKADYAVTLEEFIGKLQDTTLAVCSSCKTMLMRYDLVSKDAEWIKMHIQDMWKKTREKRCATSIPALEVMDTAANDDDKNTASRSSSLQQFTDSAAAKVSENNGPKSLSAYSSLALLVCGLEDSKH